MKAEKEPAKISIIVPVYRAENVIASCVNSILEPSLVNYLIENELVDTVDLGRAVLADPAFCEATLAASKGEVK